MGVPLSLTRDRFDRAGLWRDDLGDLENVLYVRYALSRDDQKRIESAWYTRAVQAWTQAINELLAAGGCTQNAQNPSGSDAVVMQQVAIAAGESIVSTFNTELKNQIIRMVSSGTTQTRQAYQNALDSWVAQRTATKNALITTDARGLGDSRARRRFYEENGDAGLFIWYAVPPIIATSHDECIRRVRDGAVGWTIAGEWLRPHPNCRHKVQAAQGVRLDCGNVWRG